MGVFLIPTSCVTDKLLTGGRPSRVKTFNDVNERDKAVLYKIRPYNTGIQRTVWEFSMITRQRKLQVDKTEQIIFFSISTNFKI